MLKVRLFQSFLEDEDDATNLDELETAFNEWSELNPTVRVISATMLSRTDGALVLGVYYDDAPPAVRVPDLPRVVPVPGVIRP